MADNTVGEETMTPDRAALREIAQRLKTESAYPSPSPRWYEDVERLVDGVISLTAPLLVKCGEDIAAIRKRFEDAAHDMTCESLAGRCRTCGYMDLSHKPNHQFYQFVCGAFIANPCDCWKSTFGLDALLELVAAQAREIAELKGKANG